MTASVLVLTMLVPMPGFVCGFFIARKGIAF